MNAPLTRTPIAFSSRVVRAAGMSVSLTGMLMVMPLASGLQQATATKWKEFQAEVGMALGRLRLAVQLAVRALAVTAESAPCWARFQNGVSPAPALLKEL